MLHEFITTNRLELLARCREKVASRHAPRATEYELEHGIPMFLDQLAETLRLTLDPNPALVATAAQHGHDLLTGGFTIAQVVHDYGNVCQAITQLAVETQVPITTDEFQALNQCLDNAIAGAVTEYGRLREHQGTERLGRLAHESRNLLATALLSFDALKTGSVGISGSTGAVLGRSLASLVQLIDRELADVRLGIGIHHRETVVVRDFVEDIEVAAAMEAQSRELQFSVVSVDKDVRVFADRLILTSVLANLLQNAFKFTHPHSHVVLRVRATADHVLFDVEDECGGLPPGHERMFAAFEQHGADRTGLGLGLSICDRGAQVNEGAIHVANRSGVGCMFTVDLPRVTAAS